MKNALRLAQEKPPHKPFYLVGRLGDQDLSIAAAGADTFVAGSAIFGAKDYQATIAAMKHAVGAAQAERARAQGDTLYKLHTGA